MNEIGKILEIDPKLLGDINAIGAAIDGIANAAETTAGRYKTAFTSMVGRWMWQNSLWICWRNTVFLLSIWTSVLRRVLICRLTELCQKQRAV